MSFYAVSPFNLTFDFVHRHFMSLQVALGSILGAVIQITSGIRGGRFWQLVAGKLVICISIGIASVSVPLYQAECAPAARRGALVNTYVWVQGAARSDAITTLS